MCVDSGVLIQVQVLVVSWIFHCFLLSMLGSRESISLSFECFIDTFFIGFHLIIQARFTIALIHILTCI